MKIKHTKICEMHYRHLKYAERNNQENRSMKWEMGNGEKPLKPNLDFWKYLVSDKPRLIKKKRTHTHCQYQEWM